MFVDELANEGVAKDKLYWVSFARSTPLVLLQPRPFPQDRAAGPWADGTEDVSTGPQKIYSSNQHVQPVFSAVAAKLRTGVETIQERYDTYYA